MRERFDLVYGPEAGRATIAPHFCREWDDSGGCYGTNPNHGSLFEEAREALAEFYDQLAQQIRETKKYEDLPL